MDKLIIDGIDYEIEKFYDLNYTIKKMNETLKKYGLEKAIRSQNFIRFTTIKEYGLFAKKLFRRKN